MNTDRVTGRLHRLCIFIVAAAGAEFVIATTGVQIGNLPPSTDFASYYLAGAQTRDHLSPYDRDAIAARGHALGFAHDQFPFLYPPPFALAMQPLARISYPRARQLWLLLCTADVGIALAVTGSLLRRQAAALALVETRYVWVLFAAFVPAALNSTSVHNDIRAGSVGVLLYMMLAIATVQFLQTSRRREQGAVEGWAGGPILGAALAVATLAKLTPLFLLPYVFWRGARRGAGMAVLLLTVSMVPAFVHWGPGIAADYLQHAILPSVHDEVAPPMNQSLDAYLSRLLVPVVK